MAGNGVIRSFSLASKEGFSPGYSQTITGTDFIRYLNKIGLCDNQDPFEIPLNEFVSDVKLWPKVEYMDIVNYLVLTTNSVTKDQMKAYKSMESHNYFTSGWVHQEIPVKTLPNGDALMIGKVNHSQRMRDSPLKIWILSKPSGQVLTAHCICMAGRGEVCSHVGALLFAIETGVRIRDSITCTQELSAWLPTHMKNVPYLPVKEIDFTSSKSKKIKLDHQTENAVNGISPYPAVHTFKKSNPLLCTPTEEENMEFFRKVAKSGVESAILTVLPGFQDKFVKVYNLDLAKPLNELYDEASSSLNFHELLSKCEEVFINSGLLKMSPETALSVEKATKLQAAKKLWFRLRAGRITASVMKAACRTDPANASLSLIYRICYPLGNKFTNVATKWGCEHEKEARNTYELQLKRSHGAVVVCDSGLHINPSFTHLGASPDGLVECACCGKGIVEVKCPFCSKENTVKELCLDKKSCLVYKRGKVELDVTHAYYYQVQTQIFVSNAKYCDFVLWTNKDLHVQRITPNEEFWKNTLEDATRFFKICILPELVAKWFTTQPPKNTNPCRSTTTATVCLGNHLNAIENRIADLVTYTESSNTNLFPSDSRPNKVCYCGISDERIMITCHNKTCKSKKFHLDCLRIKNKPRSKCWLCPDCRKCKSKAYVPANIHFL